MSAKSFGPRCDFPTNRFAIFLNSVEGVFQQEALLGGDGIEGDENFGVDAVGTREDELRWGVGNFCACDLLPEHEVHVLGGEEEGINFDSNSG